MSRWGLTILSFLILDCQLGYNLVFCMFSLMFIFHCVRSSPIFMGPNFMWCPDNPLFMGLNFMWYPASPVIMGLNFMWYIVNLYLGGGILCDIMLVSYISDWFLCDIIFFLYSVITVCKNISCLHFQRKFS